MVKGILHAKAIFFDNNSIGKIITRFSKDIVVFDTILPHRFSVLTVGIFRIITILILISIINPWLLIPVSLFGCFIFVFVSKI